MQTFSKEASNDERKRLFNMRLSGLRTKMTENIFGMWKRRFPILRHMNEYLENAKDTMETTAILHNMTILFNDELPPVEDGDEDDHHSNYDEDDADDDGGGDNNYVTVEDNAPRYKYVSVSTGVSSFSTNSDLDFPDPSFFALIYSEITNKNLYKSFIYV